MTPQRYAKRAREEEENKNEKTNQQQKKQNNQDVPTTCPLTQKIGTQSRTPN